MKRDHIADLKATLENRLDVYEMVLNHVKSRLGKTEYDQTQTACDISHWEGRILATKDILISVEYIVNEVCFVI